MCVRLSSFWQGGNTVSNDNRLSIFKYPPRQRFFLYEVFYSGLKEKNISEEEYERVKKVF